MHQLDDTQVFLPEVWANHARFRGNKTAIICGKQRLNWKEFNAGMNRVANKLLEMGISHGSKVAVLMDNSVHALQIMFGVPKAGACVVPISLMLQPDQVASLLADSDAEIIFASAASSELAAEAIKAPNNLRKDGLILVGFPHPDWQDFENWIQGATDQEPDVHYHMDDEFNIIYSSGTTGTPKGIVQTHRARQHWSYSNALELRFDHESIALATTGLYSNGTWFMLLPPLFVGGTIVIMEKFTPENWLTIVEREKVTHTFMVPTQYIAVLESSALGTHDISTLRSALSAGSSMRADTRRDVLSRICSGLYELYGFSEGFATICRPEQMHKIGSVGTPVIGFDLRIINDNGKELPCNEPGEIVGYGGGLMRGYHKRTELTSEAIWRDNRDRTFLRSGDIGKLDEDGFLYIIDRKKDMIISGGFNIFPKDIEEVVGSHADISDVAVIGIPHERWGETPLALIIPAPGTSPDPQQIMEWANQRLAKTQRLYTVELRQDFPRNALGKVIKRELRKPYWSVK